MTTIHHYWGIIVSILGMIGVLLRISMQLGAFVNEIRTDRKRHDADHIRYDAHLQTPHNRR